GGRGIGDAPRRGGSRRRVPTGGRLGGLAVGVRRPAAAIGLLAPPGLNPLPGAPRRGARPPRRLRAPWRRRRRRQPGPAGAVGGVPAHEPLAVPGRLRPGAGGVPAVRVGADALADVLPPRRPRPLPAADGARLAVAGGERRRRPAA